MSGSILADGVGKQFSRHGPDRPTTLKQWMLSSGKRQAAERFWALREVSFEVPPGRMLGVIGHNGSGKSTLLRLVGGVMKPDAGKVGTQGQITGMLELNSGMHPELSGRENLMIGGIVAGLSIQETRQAFDRIVAFAELEESIENPVRTYSAGMKLRLGFAVAAHARPGVLLVDEVLAVGDLAFQAKCLDRIRSLKREGAAIILASHDLSQITSLCDEALWLRSGHAVALGDPRSVVGGYRTEMANRLRRETPGNAPDRLTESGILLVPGHNRFGSFESEILDVRIRSAKGQATAAIETGNPLRIEVTYRTSPNAAPSILAVSLAANDQEDVLNVDSASDRLILPAGEQRTACLEIDRLDLKAGEYQLSVGLYSDDWDKTLDFHWRTYPIEITGRDGCKGLIDPPHRWTM